MKKILFVLVLSLVFTACKNDKKEVDKESETATVVYDSFGAEISYKDALNAADIMKKYETLKEGDTLNVKFASSIKDVCSKKGCWMKLPVGEKGDEVMVRFKDYGFFMPLDSQGREVIVEGKAFIKETSVKELQHYAKDAGKSEDEIAKITEPKRTLSFEAHGVLMKKK